MPNTHRPIFISYARGDGRELAGALRADLNMRGFNIWQDVVAMEAGEGWWLQIAGAIDGCAVMLLLLTDAALKSEVVRDEFAYARRVGTPVIPVVYDAELLHRAPSWIVQLDIVIVDGSDPGHELAYQRLINQLTNPPARRPRPFATPNLSLTLVQRAHTMQRLRSYLLSTGDDKSVKKNTVLIGGGGFGKTTLAISLCHDEVIRSAFDDGILWIQFRQHVTETDALALLNDQTALLDPDGRRFIDLTQASARFRELLAKRNILIVLDDVWSQSHLPYFIHSNATYLITTRLESVAVNAAANRIWVEELEGNQGADLLSMWVGPAAGPEDSVLLAKLAGLLGQWPLLLELVGAELRSLVSGGRTVHASVEYVERRLTRHGYTYLDRRNEEQRNTALAQSIEASLSMLPEVLRQRLSELGIFPSDITLPFATIGQLWAATGGYDDVETEDALESMRRIALFTHYDASKRELRIHSIVHHILAMWLPDAQVVHRKLLDHWSDLFALPDEYAWMFVGHHLANGDRVEVLYRLLFDFRWLYAKLSATDPVALLADYGAHHEEPDCNLLAAVLTMSGNALFDPGQLAAQLIGRLNRLDVSPAVTELLRGAISHTSPPALLPSSVSLTSVAQGVHRTIVTPSAIRDSALAENGSQLVAGLANGSIQVWDWRQSALVREFNCGVGPISSLSIIGDLVAVGGYHDHWTSYVNEAAPAEVWDWKNGQRRYSLGEDIETIREGYAVSLHGTLAAITTGAMDNTVYIYEWPLRKLVMKLEGDPSNSSSGNRPAEIRLRDGFLFYHNPGGVRVCVTSSADWRFRGYITGEIAIEAVPFVHGNVFFIRSKWRCLVKGPHFFCDVKNDKDASPAVPDVHFYHPPVSAMAVCDQGLLACSDLIEQRHLQSGALADTLEGHSGRISSVHVLSEVIISTSDDHSIRIWDRRSRERKFSRTGERDIPAAERFYRAPITCLAREGESLFVGTALGQLQKRSCGTGEIAAELALGEPIRAIAVNDDWLVYSHFERLKYAYLEVRRRHQWQTPISGGDEKKTDSFAVRGGVYDFFHRGVMKVKLFQNSCAIVLQNYYTPQNAFFAAAHDYTGNEIQIIDLSTKEMTLVGGEWISAVALSSSAVAGGNVEGTVELWDTNSGRRIHRFHAHDGAVSDMVFQGEYLITCSTDHTIRIWETSVGRLVATIQHSGTGTCLCARDNLLLIASDDHTLTLLDWRIGASLATFTDDAPLLACDWDASAATLFAGGSSGHLHVLRSNGALCELVKSILRSGA